MEKIFSRSENIKLWLSVFLTVFGCCLLVAGFIVAPMGIIDNSVLVAVGEVFTFSGCILGVNYAYQSKLKKLEIRLQDKENKKNVGKTEPNE